MKNADKIMELIKEIKKCNTIEECDIAMQDAIDLIGETIKEDGEKWFNECGLDIPDAKDIFTKLNKTKIIKGEIIPILIDNEIRMSEGCRNRLCITNNPEEYIRLYRGIIAHCKRLHDYVLYYKGLISLDIIDNLSPSIN